MPNDRTAPVLQPAEHEQSDISGTLTACLALGLATSVLGLSFLLHVAYPNAREAYGPSRLVAMGAGPQLQIDEASDIRTLRRAEDYRLNSYGWIDYNERRIRIPIERALQLTAERGLAGWPRQ
jgi:hypothetical protein